MASQLKALDIPQWGLEAGAAPGIPVALVPATSKIACKDFLVAPTDNLIRDKLLKSLAIANRGNELVSERGVNWSIPASPVVFDQFHYWVDFAFDQGPVKTGVGPFVWTGTYNPVGVQSRSFRTIEARMTDGTASNDYRFGGCVVTELQVVGALNTAVQFLAKGFARRIQTQAITAALTLPTLVEAPFSMSKVYIDSTWGTKGTTQVTGQVLGWKVTLQTGMKPEQTADARTDQDYSIATLDPDLTKVQIDVELLATATGQWLAEKTAAEAATLRAVQVQFSSGTNDIKLQALVKHTLASVFPQENKDGQQKVTLHMEGSTDDTNFLAAIVTNQVTAAIS